MTKNNAGTARESGRLSSLKEKKDNSSTVTDDSVSVITEAETESLSSEIMQDIDSGYVSSVLKAERGKLELQAIAEQDAATKEFMQGGGGDVKDRIRFWENSVGEHQERWGKCGSEDAESFDSRFMKKTFKSMIDDSTVSSSSSEISSQNQSNSEKESNWVNNVLGKLCCGGFQR